MNVISDAALRARAGCEAAVLAFFHALDTRRHEDVARCGARHVGAWLQTPPGTSTSRSSEPL